MSCAPVLTDNICVATEWVVHHIDRQYIYTYVGPTRRNNIFDVFLTNNDQLTRQVIITETSMSDQNIIQIETSVTDYHCWWVQLIARLTSFSLFKVSSLFTLIRPLFLLITWRHTVSYSKSGMKLCCWRIKRWLQLVFLFPTQMLSFKMVSIMIHKQEDGFKHAII